MKRTQAEKRGEDNRAPYMLGGKNGGESEEAKRGKNGQPQGVMKWKNWSENKMKVIRENWDNEGETKNHKLKMHNERGEQVESKKETSERESKGAYSKKYMKKLVKTKWDDKSTRQNSLKW